VNEWHWGLVAGNDTIGPPMGWYGWIASAAIVGLICAGIALLLPERATEKPWSSLIWIAPILAFVFLLNWELSWFVTGWQPLSISSISNPAPAGPVPTDSAAGGPAPADE
jgi:hypothetical protein